MSYKSGIIAAKKKIDDRWVIRMDRKGPKDKPASFYIKLLPNEREPIVGETYKIPISDLIQLPDNGGFDWYEVKPHETKGTTTVVNLENEKPAASELTPQFTHPENFDQAYFMLSNAAKLCYLEHSQFSIYSPDSIHKVVKMAALLSGHAKLWVDKTHEMIDSFFPKELK